MNTIISFEVAKLLKEKSFEGIKSPFWYYKDGTLHETPTKGYKGLKSWNTWEATQGVRWESPTIAEVVMWLYEKHGIWVNIDIEGENFDIFLFRVYRNHSERVEETLKKMKDENYHTNYNSPTEAYEEAIKYCLTELIK